MNLRCKKDEAQQANETLVLSLADFDNHVKTLNEAVGMVTSRIASVEQTVNALSAKMASFAALERLQWFRLGKIMEHTWT